MVETPHKAKILVVDDSETVLHWVRLVLGKEFTVITRTNPVGTGAAVIRERPDLVLIDVDMPLVSGDEVVVSLRKSELSRDIVVALFSGLEQELLEARAKKCKADGAIRKTGDAVELIQNVKSLLEIKTVSCTPVFKPNIASQERTDGQPVLVAGQGTLTQAQSAVLVRSGIQIRTADTVDEVYAELHSNHPKLLIIGGTLADSNALQLCQTIRATPELRGISILLKWPKRPAGASPMSVPGVNLVLTDPVSHQELGDAVTKLVNVAPRREVRLLVRIHSPKHGHLHHHGITHNLSVSGMLLETAQPVDIGEHLDVHFFAPGCRSEVATTAEVVRHHARDGERRIVGMRFLNMRRLHQAAIACFVGAAIGRRALGEHDSKGENDLRENDLHGGKTTWNVQDRSLST